MIKLWSYIHTFSNCEKQGKPRRREEKIVTFIRKEMSSLPDCQTASIFQKNMIFGEMIVCCRKSLYNGLPGLIQSLKIGIPINSANIFADNIEITGMCSTLAKIVPELKTERGITNGEIEFLLRTIGELTEVDRTDLFLNVVSQGVENGS